MNQPTPDTDFAAQIALEFRDTANDQIAAINRALAHITPATTPEALATIRRAGQVLRGTAASCGYPIVGMVCQRLDQYLQGLETAEARTRDDLQRFADQLARLAEQTPQPDGEAAAALLRDLPSRYEFHVGDVEIRNVEVLLCTPSRVVAKLVAGELAACGYRCLHLSDPVEALASALRAPPDLLIVSAVMQPINGVEVIQALRACTPTRITPAVLLTSLEQAAVAAPDLPAETVLVRTGNAFADDFAAAIARFDPSGRSLGMAAAG